MRSAVGWCRAVLPEMRCGGRRRAFCCVLGQRRDSVLRAETCAATIAARRPLDHLWHSRSAPGSRLSLLHWDVALCMVVWWRLERMGWPLGDWLDFRHGGSERRARFCYGLWTLPARFVGARSGHPRGDLRSDSSAVGDDSRWL